MRYTTEIQSAFRTRTSPAGHTNSIRRKRRIELRLYEYFETAKKPAVEEPHP